MQQDWLTRNMETVLWTLEVLWVAGVAVIFVLYFALKRKIKRKKLERDTE